jgi:hypothetical protein
MKKTLEHIQQHITETCKNESAINRFRISEKYMGLFNDYVYDVSIRESDIKLPTIIDKLGKPLFIYNDNKDGVFIASPVFALMFNFFETQKLADIDATNWFKRDWWLPAVNAKNGAEPLFTYETANGQIPEFMAQLKLNNDNNLEINVLRCPFKIVFYKDHTFTLNDVPMIFELGHSEPIHLVRFLLAPKPL